MTLRHVLIMPGDNGIRPAGPSNACFYCGRRIGEEHRLDCVIVVRRVKVRLVIEFQLDMPQSWDKEACEFRWNESTYCIDNAWEEVRRFIGDTSGGTDPDDPHCICDIAHMEYLGEADEQEWEPLPAESPDPPPPISNRIMGLLGMPGFGPEEN